MLVDYHTHHVRCGHAIGELEEYVQHAIKIGLDQIGLSDHMPLIHVDPDDYYPEMAMPAAELPRYVEECISLKEKYQEQIDIKVGLEGDYIEGYEAEIERYIDAYPWDYVIGSVHFLGTWDITDYRQVHNWEGKVTDDVYAQYYDAVQKAAQTGFYDFIGHMDVIKRFGYKAEQDTWELERQALDTIKAHDGAIELNASGLRTPAEEMFPSDRILKYCLEQRIPVTLGSDAHAPERVGQYLEKARAKLQKLGFTEIATFNRRKRIMVSLEGLE